MFYLVWEVLFLLSRREILDSGTIRRIFLGTMNALWHFCDVPVCADVIWQVLYGTWTLALTLLDDKALMRAWYATARLIQMDVLDYMKKIEEITMKTILNEYGCHLLNCVLD